MTRSPRIRSQRAYRTGGGLTNIEIGSWPVGLDGHNDNDKTWLDGITRRHPWRVALVAFVLSVPAGMVLFSAVGWLIRG